MFISPLETKKLDWKKSREVVARLAELRQTALRETSKGTAKFSQILGTVKDDRQVSYFTGTDRLNGKRFYVAVVGLHGVMVTTTVFRNLDDPTSGFEDQSERIMWSVRKPAG